MVPAALLSFEGSSFLFYFIFFQCQDCFAQLYIFTPQSKRQQTDSAKAETLPSYHALHPEGKGRVGFANPSLPCQIQAAFTVG